MRDETVVLEVGGEGGSIILRRRTLADGSGQFWIDKNETALREMLWDLDGTDDLPPAEPPIYVASLQEALQLLDKYRWFRLYALTVAPAFKEEILRAVQLRGGAEAVKRWEEDLSSPSDQSVPL